MKKYFEFKYMSQFFQMQIVKPILEYVTSKFSVRKQQFYAQFEIFSKTKYNDGFKNFRRIFTYKKIFSEAFKYQKYTKFI